MYAFALLLTMLPVSATPTLMPDALTRPDAAEVALLLISALITASDNAVTLNAPPAVTVEFRM